MSKRIKVGKVINDKLEIIEMDKQEFVDSLPIQKTVVATNAHYESYDHGKTWINVDPKLSQPEFDDLIRRAILSKCYCKKSLIDLYNIYLSSSIDNDDQSIVTLISKHIH